MTIAIIGLILSCFVLVDFCGDIRSGNSALRPILVVEMDFSFDMVVVFR